jgi:predicted DNA-binding antitoxin AbrB/MazE fold protein
MDKKFSAIYENGLLRPLEPVDLPENEVLRFALVEAPTRDRAPREGQSFYDVLVEAGLLGCIKGGPSDVSTNPKYMEGFGEHSDSD